ncbi:MauE/DoxX family redox-associated membrane protein [uncultured Algoriphagus sp.]|uniref:MauE/DoxX family redox-associated membrane protein n=1 Tax=uncultured Algoriphagus sp. TaxID=417365 RepID=UPI0030EDC891|tara:strand:- start:2811 stop:3248 length:438 start_codon:yes stop_codon:yes gene_type:complete
MEKTDISFLISLPLLILWGYTSIDKILFWQESYRAFLNQPFPMSWGIVLAYAVPGLEILLVVLVMIPETRYWGFLGSALLLNSFSVYVGMVWIGVFPETPCNCAGLINLLSWEGHLFLNLGFLTLSVLGLWIIKRGAETPPYGVK